MIERIVLGMHSLRASAAALTLQVAVAATLLIVPGPAEAEGFRIGVYSGQWADTRLPYLPYNIATGRLTFSESYLTSIIVSQRLLTRDFLIPGTEIGLSDAQVELEGTASFHRGLQTHQEATLAVMLRTRDFDCVFRSIRPLIPTTFGHLFRSIRPPVTRCREAACFGYQF